MNGAPTALNVDELVATLDQRGEKWDLYRVHDRSWCVRLGDGRDDPNGRAVRGGTIEEALTAATGSPRLPVVPRRPPVLTPNHFDTSKDGNRWVTRGHAPASGFMTTTTKKAAAEAVARACDRSVAEAMAWDATWTDLVRDGVEGVDYRWAQA